jgi:hypothetical protein
MSSISSQIEAVLDNYVNNFFNSIKERFSDHLDENGDAYISLNDVISLWNQWNVKSDNVPKQVQKNVNQVLMADKKEETKKTETKSVDGCQYINSRGDNKGKPCGGKVSQSSKSGKYCTKHLKEEKEEKETKTETKKSVEKVAPKKTKDDFTPATKEELKQKIEERKPTINIMKNKYGNYEHADTHIVLDKESHMAYGKQVNDKVIPLSSDDIEMCKILNFKYKLPESLSTSSKAITYDSDSDSDEDIYDDEDDLDEELDD